MYYGFIVVGLWSVGVVKKASVDVEPKDLGQILDRLCTVRLCDIVQVTYGL